MSKLRLLRSRVRTHCLAQGGAYFEVSGLLGVQLVPEVDKGLYRKLGMVMGDVEYIMTSEGQKGMYGAKHKYNNNS